MWASNRRISVAGPRKQTILFFCVYSIKHPKIFNRQQCSCQLRQVYAINLVPSGHSAPEFLHITIAVSQRYFPVAYIASACQHWPFTKEFFKGYKQLIGTFFFNPALRLSSLNILAANAKIVPNEPHSSVTVNRQPLLYFLIWFRARTITDTIGCASLTPSPVIDTT